ncbi:hypothetical protein AC477_00035 [miscellaneous Crenarchaeota group-1 archaeon SG8-32-1]|uniref:Uncharacterized protein n=1 Tax=miscellaneous Crenarchaeota group-1 archaeon SG8-32-1 TaxID=1685124 RepID=A0A0M0C1R9_9ARCH|nr:MAG: hypothetical protein AC477_00035 [miscellaneous Crenarchaeota group-1 archaeon SG8-32-1]
MNEETVNFLRFLAKFTFTIIERQVHNVKVFQQNELIEEEPSWYDGILWKEWSLKGTSITFKFNWGSGEEKEDGD